MQRSGLDVAIASPRSVLTGQITRRPLGTSVSRVRAPKTATAARSFTSCLSSRAAQSVIMHTTIDACIRTVVAIRVVLWGQGHARRVDGLPFIHSFAHGRTSDLPRGSVFAELDDATAQLPQMLQLGQLRKIPNLGSTRKNFPVAATINSRGAAMQRALGLGLVA